MTSGLVWHRMVTGATAGVALIAVALYWTRQLHESTAVAQAVRAQEDDVTTTTNSRPTKAIKASPKARCVLGLNPVAPIQDSTGYRWWLVEHNYLRSSLLAGAQIVALCESTDVFRSLAKHMVRGNDVVVEIGSSTGMATAILAKAVHDPEQVLGIDTSLSQLEIARERYPHITFARMDVVHEPVLAEQTVAALMARAGSKGDGAAHLKVFLDIGGNREFETIVRVIKWVQTSLNPTLVVVKSETLFATVDKRRMPQAALNELAISSRDWKPRPKQPLPLAVARKK